MFFLLSFCLIAIICNAQTIFTKIYYYDKFDDALKIEQRKTLITHTDSTFVIEEKGCKPVVYYILNEVEIGTMGSKENVVNLVADVYGYQKTWCIVRYDLLKKYQEDVLNYTMEKTDENLKKIQQYWIFAVSRTITTQYTGAYQDEMFWLQDEDNEDKLGKGVKRVIYLR